MCPCQKRYVTQGWSLSLPNSMLLGPVPFPSLHPPPIPLSLSFPPALALFLFFVDQVVKFSATVPVPYVSVSHHDDHELTL